MDNIYYQRLKQEGEWHWWAVGRRLIIASFLKQAFQGKHDLRILEAGSGAGTLLPTLKPYGHVTALEPHPDMAEFVRQQHPDVTVLQAPIPTRLEGCFDVICLFDVLEHIQDEVGTMAWLDAHLNPGGYVVLTVPAFPFLWSKNDDLSHHKRRYVRRTLTATLLPTFSISRLSYFNFHLFPIVSLVRLFLKWLKLDDGRDNDMGTSGPINTLLTWIFASERYWLRMVDLPFGVSLIALARKNVEGGGKHENNI